MFLMNMYIKSEVVMTFDEIWQQYKEALKRFLQSKVSNQTDVDDILQDVLVRMLQNMSSIRDQTKIKSWLFQIANNTVIDFYRAKGRINQVQTNLVEEPTMTNSTLSKDSKLETNEALASCLIPFINALPKEDALLLLQIDIHKVPQKQYAAQLGISYSTLKSRVQKSRLALRRLFEQCCYFHLDSRGNIYDHEREDTFLPKQTFLS